jgi:nicotinamidase-related amidase
VATSGTPVVVLMDIHEALLPRPRGLPRRMTEAALRNCRLVLELARGAGLPIAFVRRRTREQITRQPRGWLEAFAPRTADMIFERDLPSCYSSPEFGRAIQDGGGSFILTGFAGEFGCLSTLVEAFHRGHRAIYLWDASASRSMGTLNAEQTHMTLAEVMRTYAHVMDTQLWIAGSTRRLVGV